jgi:hypothetical protein
MNERANLRWGVERRLEFIEFRLFWEGHVNRSDLMEVFGISIQQASTDLNRYLGMATGNMTYDKSAKAYIRGVEFAPLFLQPDADRYLSQLRLVSDGILDSSETWINQLPAVDSTPTLARAVNAKILRSVVASMRRRESLEIRYQSLSHPEPRWRWITPHAIGFDGFRWHARAFCGNDAAFKDFVFSRIMETRGTKAEMADPSADSDWQEQVVLEIGPHPALSATQKQAIGVDYGMVDGKVKIRVRRSLLYYALKRLGLDTDPSARRPQDQQIVLLNTAAADSFHREGNR